MALIRILYMPFGLVLILLSVLSSGGVHGEKAETGDVNENEVNLVESPPLENGDYGYNHLVNKRFSDSFDDADMLGVPGMYDESMPIYEDKRQASRWKYIYRNLYDIDNAKRSPLRWKLIYQKLNSINNRSKSSQKRFAGRWKNQNWLLNRGNEEEDEHSLQKRHIGRWKNNNWMLQQRMNSK